MLHDPPLISVLIITYNQDQYLVETLESVLKQDYPNIEIIVSDDGSTDGTQALLESYATKHPEKIFPVLNNANAGITKNTNCGLRKCRGEFIALLGGDDYFVSPNKLSVQEQWLSADPRRVLCGHDSEIFDSHSGKVLQLFSQKKKLSRGVGPGWFISHGIQYAASTIMIRRSCMPDHLCREEIRISSDWLFYVECLMPEGVYGYVPNVLSRYRRHGGNITSLSTLLDCTADLLMSLGCLEPFFPEHLSKVRVRRRKLYCMAGNAYLRMGKSAVARRYYRASLGGRGVFRLTTYGALALTCLPASLREKMIDRKLAEAVSVDQAQQTNE